MSRSLNLTVTPVVQNAQYVSGNVIGGLISLTCPNGIISDVTVQSVGGSTPTITIYLFHTNPVNSTITDKTAFTFAGADAIHLLQNPSVVTLAVPTGSTPSFGSATQLALPVQNKNRDVPPLLYIVLVSGSTFTPATVSDINVTIGVYAD